jgi:replicative DNA helicase
MQNSKDRSLDLERKFLAGIMHSPACYNDVSVFFKADSLKSNSGSSVHYNIFSAIEKLLAENSTLDPVLIANLLGNLKVDFLDNISILDYLNSIDSIRTTEGTTIESAKALMVLYTRRNIRSMAFNIASKVDELEASATIKEIISTADSVYNSVNMYTNMMQKPVNLFETAQWSIEERGNNPREEYGLMGPHKMINDIYGPILKGGNIACVAARTGVGKTNFTVDYCLQTGLKYNIPVLHFDNGEMSESEILDKLISNLAKVPHSYIEKGTWRKNEEYTRRVRDALALIKGHKFIYFDVGGKKPEELFNLLRRTYYSEVGRGNPMIFNFDYVKMRSSALGRNQSKYEAIADMLDGFKEIVNTEIKHHDIPQIAMMTSVQTNRAGIVNNRSSAEITEDESVIALADAISQLVSHLFLLRPKTDDEVFSEPAGWGTHKLVPFKARHMGEHKDRHFQKVDMPDGSKRANYLLLEYDQFFSFIEKGDLHQMATHMNTTGEFQSET